MNGLNPCIILANKMANPLAFSMYLVATPNIETRTHTFVFGTRTNNSNTMLEQAIKCFYAAVKIIN